MQSKTTLDVFKGESQAFSCSHPIYVLAEFTGNGDSGFLFEYKKLEQWSELTRNDGNEIDVRTLYFAIASVFIVVVGLVFIAIKYLTKRAKMRI